MFGKSLVVGVCALGLLLLIIFTGFLIQVNRATAADEQAPIEWQPLPGAEYYTAGNAMVVVVETPIVADRFKTYGKVNVAKDGTRDVDKKNEGSVTPAGMQLYQALMAIKTDKNAFKLYSATLEHTRLFIVKYEQYTWEELLPELTTIFEGFSGKEETKKAD